MAKLVSKVYGDALFQAAEEKNCLDAIYEEVLALQTVLKENKDLMQLLNHPLVVKEEKLQIITNVFEGKVSGEMMGFLLTVVTKGRQNELPAMFSYFVELVKEVKRIGTAYVTSAVATTQYVEFEMNYEVDSSLIGGMIIRIGDRVVDSSIKTQLYELKKQLMDVQLA